ncbi:hypothetical protein QR680_004731 [Steinernema hermaphroditum]|uniref:ATP-grasp domain-containing protein n=1 Tax=Steinernema hermaphroditum TaxID=289476 RepID=A0AA39HRY0_9BILA|nr:hypothetical protein QR680_004731 [Steinernema hermaphroditum]
MSPEEREVLRRLATSKKKIFVVIRRKTVFFSCMKGLTKPEHAGLVAFIPEQNRGTISDHIRKCFDLVVFYDQSRNQFYDVDSYEDVRIPDKDAFGDQLVEVVGDKSKIELLLTEESANREVARLGERLGVKYVHRIQNKDLMIDAVKKSGIPTARSIPICLSSAFSTHQLLSQIEERIGSYPVFIRPTSMADCNGTATIESQEEMRRWLDENRGKKQVCLIEEYLSGREWVAVVCLLNDGTFEPLLVRFLEFGWSNVLHIDTGHPLLLRMDTFDNAQHELPNIETFVSRVVAALRPPRPHIFTIQGFQRKERSEDYVFVECSYRPAGNRINSVCHKVCGVCQETALFMSHMDPTYRPVVNKSAPNNEIYLWYPCQKGVLEEYTPLPKENVSSEITVKWLKPLGSLLSKAKLMSHQMVYLTVKNDDPDKLLEEARWIADNWMPKLKPIVT